MEVVKFSATAFHSEEVLTDVTRESGGAIDKLLPTVKFFALMIPCHIRLRVFLRLMSHLMLRSCMSC